MHAVNHFGVLMSEGQMIEYLTVGALYIALVLLADPPDSNYGRLCCGVIYSAWGRTICGFDCHFQPPLQLKAVFNPRNLLADAVTKNDLGCS